MDLLVTLALVVIFGLVLALPFRVKSIEHNLELFLFACGVAALTIAGFAGIPGEHTGWSAAIVIEALTSPLNITNLFGVPIGIVQIVLLAGILLWFFYHRVQGAVAGFAGRVPVRFIVPGLIVILGLVASIISAILAAIVLVEIVNALPLGRQMKIDITVVSCFSIGLGAGLTPLGEPLTTIAISKLAGPPYNAGFGFLVGLVGVYIIPAVIMLGLAGYYLASRHHADNLLLECLVERESIRDVVVRAGKVYLFIMALIFLGEGFKPLILTYVVSIPPAGLYWINIASAVLDNATLAAAEISPVLSAAQIKGALMGLLIAGGMLIPGNIPNIIAAGRLGITSPEWARTGIPIGLILMAGFFALIFIPGFLRL
ncbi:MAG TPA: DUF1646 family protein [Methanoregula sp.]|nr:DUF1646 family protein [Methanoregula sp.]